jgi:hypothetical protein
LHHYAVACIAQTFGVTGACLHQVIEVTDVFVELLGSFDVVFHDRVIGWLTGIDGLDARDQILALEGTFCRRFGLLVGCVRGRGAASLGH